MMTNSNGTFRMLEFFSGIGASVKSDECSFITTFSQQFSNCKWVIFYVVSSNIHSGGMRCAVEQVLLTTNTPLFCRAFDIFNEANSVYRHNFNDEPHSGGVDFPTGVSTKLVEQLRPEDIPASDLWTMYVSF